MVLNSIYHQLTVCGSLFLFSFPLSSSFSFISLLSAVSHRPSSSRVRMESSSSLLSPQLCKCNKPPLMELSKASNISGALNSKGNSTSYVGERECNSPQISGKFGIFTDIVAMNTNEASLTNQCLIWELFILHSRSPYLRRGRWQRDGATTTAKQQQRAFMKNRRRGGKRKRENSQL